MKFLARWSVVLALCAAVAATAMQPAWERTTGQTASPYASTEAAATSSGFASSPAPEKAAFIGPGVALVGATTLVAFVPARSFEAWRLPSKTAAAANRSSQTSHAPTHLRSIPLLI